MNPPDGWVKALIVAADDTTGAELWHKTVADGELTVAIPPRKHGQQHQLGVAHETKPGGFFEGIVGIGKAPSIPSRNGPGGRPPRLDELAEVVNRFVPAGAIYAVLLVGGSEHTAPAGGWPLKVVTLLRHIGQVTRVASPS